MKVILSLIALSFIALPVQADILMEGWYKVLSANVHVGYLVTQVEYDPKTKQSTSRKFLRTSPAGGNITESLEAVSNEGFQPVSYKYTSLTDGVSTKIDASFKNGKMTAVVEKAGKKETRSLDIEKGVFLSEHLALVMMKQKGVSIGKNFEYSAIAEEDAAVAKGKSLVKEMKAIAGIEHFRIINRFKSVQFVSLMSKHGQIVSTITPELGIKTELVKTRTEAIGKIEFSEKSMNLLFRNKLPK